MSLLSWHLLAATLFLLLGQAPGGEPAGPEIQRLIMQLGSDRFEEREAAGKRLEQIGEPALPALEKATRHRDAEVRRRAVYLLEDIAGRLHARALATVKACGGKVKVDPRISPYGISVDLSGKNVKNSDLYQLKWVRGLTELNLSDTPVTDAGLTHLKGVPLSYLILARTRITGEGLRQLRRYERVRGLDLSGTQVTDAGLAHLNGMETLEGLDLSGTPVTDRGIAALRNCKSLYGIDISDTQVTDAGLDHLRGLPLRILNLPGTRVTSQAVAELRKALPEAVISGVP
jgi:hypothetical protein